MRAELYCGFDNAMFAQIRDMLDVNKIKHTYNVVDYSNPTEIVTSGNRTVSEDMTKQYYIYVSGKDYEKAQMLLDKLQKGKI